MPHPHHSRFGSQHQPSPTKASFLSHSSETSVPTQNDTRLSRRSASTPQEETRSSISRSSSRSSLSLDFHDIKPPSFIIGPLPESLESPYGGALEESGSYADSFSPSLYLYDHDSPYSTAQTPTGINEPLPIINPRRKSPAAAQSLYDPFFCPPSLAVASSNISRRSPLSDPLSSSYMSSRLISPSGGPSQLLSYRSHSPEPPSPTESSASSDSSFSSSSVAPPFQPSPRSSVRPTSHHSHSSSQHFPDLTSNLSQTLSHSSTETASSSSPLSPSSSLPSTPTIPEPLTSPSKETYAESVRQHTRAMMAQAGGGLMMSPERSGAGLGVYPGPSPRPRKKNAGDAIRSTMFRGTMVYQADTEVEPTY